jgi:hypothetical protein
LQENLFLNAKVLMIKLLIITVEKYIGLSEFETLLHPVFHLKFINYLPNASASNLVIFLAFHTFNWLSYRMSNCLSYPREENNCFID